MWSRMIQLAVITLTHTCSMNMMESGKCITMEMFILCFICLQFQYCVAVIKACIIGEFFLLFSLTQGKHDKFYRRFN